MPFRKSECEGDRTKGSNGGKEQDSVALPGRPGNAAYKNAMLHS